MCLELRATRGRKVIKYREMNEHIVGLGLFLWHFLIIKLQNIASFLLLVSRHEIKGNVKIQDICERISYIVI